MLTGISIKTCDTSNLITNHLMRAFVAQKERVRGALTHSKLAEGVKVAENAGQSFNQVSEDMVI